MKKLLCILCAASPFSVFSQNTGIGTTTPTNRLHVVANTDPIRLEGVQSAAGTDSLLTISSTGIVRRRNSGSNTGGWGLNGNSGTSPQNNFLGTTDNQPLVFRTNNLRSALIDPDSTRRNNSFGNRALGINPSGSGNNSFGYQAMGKLSTGNNNIALGDSSAFNLTGGSGNVAVGTDALQSAVTGFSNVAIGTGALKNIVSSENIGIGSNAAANTQTGANLLAIGANALSNNVATNTQIAIGNNSLQQMNNGQENVSIGYNSGLRLATGSSNVLLGHYALSSTNSSSNNTIIGHNAALAYTSGGTSNNTFIGYQSALSQTAGNNNTFVGAGVDLPGTNTSVGNSSALGQGVQITASNQIRIGNSTVNSIGGQVGWTTFSDARIKKNVRNDVPGLAFITALQPVTYNYDLQQLKKIQGQKSGPVNREEEQFQSTRFTGLIAQEVEAAGNKIGYDFSGVDAPPNENTPYGLRYAELVVPLIQSVKELKSLVDRQQQEIDSLKAILEEKKNRQLP
jgi:hypothetical protein